MPIFVRAASRGLAYATGSPRKDGHRGTRWQMTLWDHPRRPVPQTSIDGPTTDEDSQGPKKKSRRRNARFEFRSEPAGAAFQCRMDGGRFRPCASPVRYRRVVPGHHVFEVRAVTSTGGVDVGAGEERLRGHR